MEGDRPVLISAIEHYAYCARQCALIHVEGLWSDNAATVRGTFGHRRPDTAPDRTERGRRVLRGLRLHSDHYGLEGRADVVEVHPDGRLVPVEYKIGTRHGDTADRQLCAQALCLEEMTGQLVAYGYVWYSLPRRRQRVDFDAELRQRTIHSIEEIGDLFRMQTLPPAPDDERCPSCQLLGHCLPDQVSSPAVVLSYLAHLTTP